MIDEFHSEKELLERVKPALNARVSELSRQGYTVPIMDIWNYLVEMKWKVGTGLMLSDIVNDIMHVQYEEIETYQEEINLFE